MRHSNCRPALGIIIAGLIVAFSFSPQFRLVYNLPSHLHIIEGEKKIIQVSFPLTVTVIQDNKKTVIINDEASKYVLSRQILFKPVHLGNATVNFRLLGLIPIRTVQVSVLPAIKVLPGGHSIGVILHSQGVLIVGFSPVESSNSTMNPAKDAGIQVGDVILSINGIPVQNDSQVAHIIDTSGRQKKNLDILIKRGKERKNVSVNPVLCSETKRYRIGLFVRDSAAGVGTLTFVDPETKIFGALGHVITDSDTNQPIECDQGKIVMATVSGIQSGKRGQPGEKVGVFIEEDKCVGMIKKNTSFGIYGSIQEELTHSLYTEPIPVASMSQIQIGKAEMLTVIDGQHIEKFALEIQKINLQNIPDGKGMVIKVVDKSLLDKTGGIVQGMSGSPIIQNGKIIGAVTHVFVHDPTKGYGCFIDWMLMESGLLPKTNAKLIPRRLFTFSGY